MNRTPHWPALGPAPGGGGGGLSCWAAWLTAGRWPGTPVYTPSNWELAAAVFPTRSYWWRPLIITPQLIEVGCCVLSTICITFSKMHPGLTLPPVPFRKVSSVGSPWGQEGMWIAPLPPSGGAGHRKTSKNWVRVWGYPPPQPCREPEADARACLEQLWRGHRCQGDGGTATGFKLVSSRIYFFLTAHQA